MYFDRPLIYFKNQQSKVGKNSLISDHVHSNCICLQFREICLLKTFLIQYKNTLSFQEIEILDAIKGFLF